MATKTLNKNEKCTPKQAEQILLSSVWSKREGLIYKKIGAKPDMPLKKLVPLCCKFTIRELGI